MTIQIVLLAICALVNVLVAYKIGKVVFRLMGAFFRILLGLLLLGLAGYLIWRYLL
jgi:putative Mn2+ efflux pump MntP